jgi:hypothetical protein
MIKMPAIVPDDFLQETVPMLDHIIVPVSPCILLNSHEWLMCPIIFPMTLH